MVIVIIKRRAATANWKTTRIALSEYPFFFFKMEFFKISAGLTLESTKAGYALATIVVNIKIEIVIKIEV